MFSRHVLFGSVLFRKRHMIILAFLSFAGFSFGIYTASVSDSNIFSLMRLAACSPVSIVRIILVVLLPLLFSAVAVMLSKSHLLFPIVFIKSCFYAFCMYGICIEFMGAGWLVCLLLLFTDSAVLLAVHWFGIRHISGFSYSALSELAMLTIVCVATGLIDAMVISPFLATLLLR